MDDRTSENPACVARSVRLICVLSEPLLSTKRPAKRDQSQLHRVANLIFFACAPLWFILHDAYVRCLLYTNVRYSRDIPCLLYCFSSMSHRIARRDVSADWKWLKKIPASWFFFSMAYIAHKYIRSIWPAIGARIFSINAFLTIDVIKPTNQWKEIKDTISVSFYFSWHNLKRKEMILYRFELAKNVTDEYFEKLLESSCV